MQHILALVALVLALVLGGAVRAEEQNVQVTVTFSGELAGRTPLTLEAATDYGGDFEMGSTVDGRTLYFRMSDVEQLLGLDPGSFRLSLTPVAPVDGVVIEGLRADGVVGRRIFQTDTASCAGLCEDEPGCHGYSVQAGSTCVLFSQIHRTVPHPQFVTGLVRLGLHPAPSCPVSHCPTGRLE